MAADVVVADVEAVEAVVVLGATVTAEPALRMSFFYSSYYPMTDLD